jgi:hypothetical protein
MEFNIIKLHLAHSTDLNLEAGPTPMRERVDSTRVSSFGFIFGSLHNFIATKFIMLVSVCRVSCMLAAHRSASTCS